MTSLAVGSYVWLGTPGGEWVTRERAYRVECKPAGYYLWSHATASYLGRFGTLPAAMLAAR